jgi:predicted dehydrogenase
VVHPTYDALLADPSIDAVYIPLPNHMHVEWTLNALAAGKHVLTEKPIALKAREIDQIIAARDRTKLAGRRGLHDRPPPAMAAREGMAGGGRDRRSGPCRRGLQLQPDRHGQYPHEARNRRRVSLRDIGVYTFGSMRFVTGAEPVDISARIHRDNGVDTFAQVAATMEGPKKPHVGRFTYGSMTSMRMYNRQVATFQGTKGMIRLEGGPFNANVNDLAEVELHQNGNRVTVERFPTANQYKLQVEAFGRTRARRGGLSLPAGIRARARRR